MKEHIWNHVVTKKVFEIYFRFFKVDTLCQDDSIAHSCNSLNQLHLECFSNSLEGVPTYAEHLLAAFPSLLGPTHSNSNHLNWVEVGRLWRPGHLMQHSITLLLGQIAFTQPGCVFYVNVLLKNK